MRKIIVIGGGGHAKVVISILKKLKTYRILGYVANENNREILGADYLGDDGMLPKVICRNKKCCAAVGIGNIEISEKRVEVFEKLIKLGYELPAIVSPDSIVNEDVQIGKGTVVCDGAVINSGSRIGEGVIINTKSSVDHDCNIADFAYLAPGATICGGVVVGKNSIIGAGATVIQYKTIGKNCVVGAGAVVVTDCNKSGQYLGVPAKRKQ